MDSALMESARKLHSTRDMTCIVIIKGDAALNVAGQLPAALFVFIDKRVIYAEITRNALREGFARSVYDLLGARTRDAIHIRSISDHNLVRRVGKPLLNGLGPSDRRCSAAKH